jgi:signal transduction histidine kinase
MHTRQDLKSSPECADPLAVVEQAAVAEELLSGPRHTARTKLATVRNAAYVIRQKLVAMAVLAQDPRLERFLGHIESEVDELAKILSEGNISSSLHRSRPEPISPRQPILRGALLTCRRPEGRVAVDAIPEVTVFADGEELALAVRCLVENAVDASPEGSKVVVRCIESDKVVRIEVEDAGSPMSAEAVTRAVHPFETTKPGHAGLGLSIARRFALKSGGGLTLDPAPAGGLIARLELPRHHAGTEPQDSQSAELTLPS